MIILLLIFAPILIALVYFSKGFYYYAKSLYLKNFDNDFKEYKQFKKEVTEIVVTKQ